MTPNSTGTHTILRELTASQLDCTMPTSGLYTRSVTGLDEHHDKLYTTQYQSVIRDYMERGLLGVSPFHRLQGYADVRSIIQA